jgi:hypothetical protein
VTSLLVPAAVRIVALTGVAETAAMRISARIRPGGGA